jgi:hypothetical protein
MLFATIRSSTSQSKASSTCDVFAVACDLKAQLHTIEERFAKGQELNEELKHKRNELQEIARLFELIEANEKAVRLELERELERALEDLPYEHAAALRLDPEASISSIMEHLAQDARAEISHHTLGRCILLLSKTSLLKCSRQTKRMPSSRTASATSQPIRTRILRDRFLESLSLCAGRKSSPCMWLQL